MSICFGCGSKFGFFRREHSCGNCGKVHCSKCLTHKAFLPSSQVQQNICSRCHDACKHDKVSGNMKYPGAVEVVNLPGAPPPYPGEEVPTTSHLPSNSSRSNALPDPDAKIRQRLENLKKENGLDSKADISEASINERFSRLTGREALSTKNDILTPRPRLTEQEQIDQLMEKTKAEVEIAGRGNTIEDRTGVSTCDIEDRLLTLQGIDPKSIKKSDMNEEDSSDDEAATARIIKKAFAEAKIDEKVEADGFGHFIKEQDAAIIDGLAFPSVPKTQPASSSVLKRNYSEEDVEKELPWCCICNEDAILRCHGCDDDLYCKTCFREGHSRFDMDDHETSPFRLNR